MKAQIQQQGSEQPYPPLLGIAIPTYNRADKIKRQAHAVIEEMAAVEASVELTILDNASTDQTPNVLKELVATQPAIRLIRNHCNIGFAGNYLKAIQEARGKFLWVLGDDDPIDKGILKTIVSTLTTEPHLRLLALNFAQKNGVTQKVYKDCYYMKEQGKSYDGFCDFRKLMATSSHSSWLWISGNIFASFLAKQVTQSLRTNRNWTTPFLISAVCAAAGAWRISEVPTITMVTDTSSWADTLSRRVYGIDFPAVLKKLAALGYEIRDIDQFKQIHRGRWRLRVGDLRRRGLDSIVDLWKARL